MENGLQANEIFTMIMLGIVIMLCLAVAFVLLANRSQKRIYREQMKAKALQLAHQEQLLYSTILTQEEERKRIAKDLHDEIGSKLNVINLNLHRLRKFATEPTVITDTVHDLFEIIGNTIDTTRRISHDLLPPTLENFGLREAVRELCESYPGGTAPEVVFDLLQDHPLRVDKSIELNVFRILQELINNSIRHGRASRIGIRLWLKPDGISLGYQDNGRGFDPEKVRENPGLGLQNIQSRINMIGADYQLQSQPGKGVQVQIDYRIHKVP
ncbi:sensor histidine kinase [Flavilitoribacter nigricans]|uniref:histidine kinase n=1 Tax=Flavilitoribacter nigricans (strain ATCC 23147 / DSM 23189 / NBRC 102662 / NCIMB 1420 / SS-2) TaxID=1122177 RepID=A0A2D0NC83_FLAN2|nr:sensor histidine kinase [Flavilitoribacter nigricans]PHN05980.1 two-component sensor histidine kinase [Flavilitoribacter nigricans DSM 23189 = NBRC 102662]